MAVKVIVLSNGDKVIGNVNSYDALHMLSVENPFILKEIMTPEGYSMVPLPLVPTSDSEIKINGEHIVVEPCNPKEELLDMYQQMTSNIILPKSNSGLKLV